MTAQELKLDYFKFYDVENREAEGDLLLRGQFDQRPQKVRIRLVDFFGNAVADSAEVGHRRSGATLVTAMISEVPHMSQEFCCWRGSNIISFPSSRFWSTGHSVRSGARFR
jgi:hypothetical protein